ncbi:MAG: threonine/serine dehydratase [Acidobacteriaceae bacterium]|nr:threonine/serine dehydratase [Acidobacteriaceae bacterium]
MIPYSTLEEAHQRIHGVAIETPLTRFRDNLLLKDESKQPIGAFKLRGAYNMVAQLTADQLQHGVITFSSGNHAQGVAYAARALGAKAVIVMPSNSPQVKIDATRALGAEVVFVGPASLERKLKAEALAREHGYTIIPPYDDERIIAGQATCGLEILKQLGWNEQSRSEDALILSPVSGGGLLSGVSTGIKQMCAARQWQAPPVWGVEPELAADAAESFRTRTLVEWPAEKTTRTLADGLRTQSLGQKNFEHILRFTDGIVTVSEAELRLALGRILRETSIVAEPSGAVTLAAALFHGSQLPTARRIVAIVSGGNIDPQLRAEILAEPATPTTV